MHEGRHDTGMQRPDLLEPGCREWPLRRRALVDANAHLYFAQKGKDAGDVIEAGYDRSLAVRLGQDPIWRDAAMQVNSARRHFGDTSGIKTRASKLTIRHQPLLESVGCSPRHEDKLDDQGG